VISQAQYKLDLRTQPFPDGLIRQKRLQRVQVCRLSFSKPFSRNDTKSFVKQSKTCLKYFLIVLEDQLVCPTKLTILLARIVAPDAQIFVYIVSTDDDNTQAAPSQFIPGCQARDEVLQILDYSFSLKIFVL